MDQDVIEETATAARSAPRLTDNQIFERLRTFLGNGQRWSAKRIARRAGWSHETARNRLDRFVRSGGAGRAWTGNRYLYWLTAPAGAQPEGRTYGPSST